MIAYGIEMLSDLLVASVIASRNDVCRSARLQDCRITLKQDCRTEPDLGSLGLENSWAAGPVVSRPFVSRPFVVVAPVTSATNERLWRHL